MERRSAGEGWFEQGDTLRLRLLILASCGFADWSRGRGIRIFIVFIDKLLDDDVLLDEVGYRGICVQHIAQCI